MLLASLWIATTVPYLRAVARPEHRRARRVARLYLGASMLFFAVALVAAFALLYLGLRLLRHVLSLPAQVREFRARRRRERAQGAFAAALQAYYEGRYARAGKEAEIAFEDGAAPGLAALLAARAAHPRPTRPAHATT